MKKIAVAVSTALVLVGCVTNTSAPGLTSGPMPRVYVVTPEGQRLISVNPDYIRVQPGSGMQTIVWQLRTTPGYSFPDDAISGFTPMLHGTGASQQLSPPAGTQFTCQKLNNTTYQCQYANQQLGRYKYLVKVNADDGNNPPPLDPAVGND
jgi:hypothetical protein